MRKYMYEYRDEYSIGAIIAAYFVIAMILSGIATAVICLFLNMFVMPFFKSKAMSKAWKEGRAIEAKKYDDKFPKGDSQYDPYGGRYIYGYYKYTYGGKEYKYEGVFVTTPPESITLYFKKKPSKAKPEHDFGVIEHEWKPIFCVLTVVFCIVLPFFF